MKAIKFKEKDLYSIQLSRGIYLIDGRVTSLDGYNNNVQVKDIDNVIPINRKKVTIHYISNDKIMSLEDYISIKKDLLSKRIDVADDDYSCAKYETLEDEFAYKKFIQTWTSVDKDIEIQGDPYKFDTQETNIDSGNPYILSDYINGGANPLLWVYKREEAVLAIVRNKFTELGLVYNKDISYNGTSHKKVWGNSTHSCIRYVTAFGTYIFSDTWKNICIQRGSLESLLSKYKSDKEKLEDIIQTKYNIHFGKINTEEFDFDYLLKNLKMIDNLLNVSNFKMKNRDIYFSCEDKLKDSISIIERKYEVKD